MSYLTTIFIIVVGLTAFTIGNAIVPERKRKMKKNPVAKEIKVPAFERFDLLEEEVDKEEE